MDVVTRDGPFTLPLNCEYFGSTKVNEQNCAVDFSKSGLKDPPSGKRQKVIVVETGNKHFPNTADHLQINWK
jgi:hypothetical protein